MDTSAGASRREVLKKFATAIAAAVGAARLRRGLEICQPEASGRAEPLGSGIKTPFPEVPAGGAEKTHFFSPEEKEVIATVADLIIPTDEVSPGARAAGVHDWIDFVVANSPAPVQQQWREGLRALDHSSEERAGRKFLALDPEKQRKLLEEFAQREEAAATPGERFFALAKEATVNGYYTSEIGLMKDLKYQGGTYTAEPDTSCPGAVRHTLNPKTP